ncbi:hypothetical protein FB45DRAFT_169771 [Roridomyces roridus]|uniref:TEA domain-containing protein n=1 Tax=Roridomyces roridus TaxID=1738132 RepID=A0AAD7BEC0_9AGAR|nr:hypothetical protein FB45DRAFT_169771 [Roridomyces roridus]
MSDSNLYSRLLLSKGHGYPLFGPQPFDDLPPDSRRLGTQIGDVGVVTADGSFDVIFNICRSADDPLNRFGVPERFEQVRIGPGDIASRPQYHRPGSDVSNTRISKRRLDVDTGVESNVFLPLGVGAVVEISTSSKEAAVLLLPDGASRTDLRCLKNQFRDYALKHAHRWYAFVNGTLGMMIESGDLYLVTGMDKSTSWSVAAIEDHSEDCRISLKLKAAQIGSAGTSCAWEWETTSSFANSGPRRQPGEEDWTDNQTVFIRGFKITIRSRSSPLQKSVKVPAIVGSKPSEILTRSGYIPYSQSSSSTGGAFSRGANSSATGGTSDSESDDEGSVEYFPDIVPAYHPSNVINEHLLDRFPMIDVAITHDDEWAAVLNEHDTEMPNESELIERIEHEYNAETSDDGVWLSESSQDDPSLSPESIPEDHEPPPKRRNSKRKQPKHLKDAPGIPTLWPERVENLLISGLREYQNSPWASNFTRDRAHGRHQFLVDHLKSLGVVRSKKQVASRLQILKVRWEGKPEYRLLAAGDELLVYEFGNAVEEDRKTGSPPSISSPRPRQNLLAPVEQSHEKADYRGLVQQGKLSRPPHSHLSDDDDDEPPGNADYKIPKESESAREAPEEINNNSPKPNPPHDDAVTLPDSPPGEVQCVSEVRADILQESEERTDVASERSTTSTAFVLQLPYFLESPAPSPAEASTSLPALLVSPARFERTHTPSAPEDAFSLLDHLAPSPPPFHPTWPPLQSGAAHLQEVIGSVLKVRKTWKTIPGETVWPPELEVTLLEALEKYVPDDSRETRMLGRFPRRNRFISDYIFDKTGKRRTAKQVGSRLQQLRESCGEQKLLHQLSPFCRPEPPPSEASSSLPDLQNPSTPPWQRTPQQVETRLQQLRESFQPGVRDYGSPFLAPPIDTGVQTGDVPELLDLIYQTVEGWEYLHSKDTVHADLRGVHILLDDGTAMLVGSYDPVKSPQDSSILNAWNTPDAPSILLPHKPFRCPKPNCRKSYKQANGLKYHMTHGSCNLAPAHDVEAVRALLEGKRATAAATVTEEEDDSSAAATPKEANTESAGLSQAEINEVEARVRPFACGVGDCSRRYKNMNGLRYHYQHSGDHGAVGLSLLAGGVHACLNHACLKPGAASSASARTSTVNATTTTATKTTGKKEATPFLQRHNFTGTYTVECKPNSRGQSGPSEFGEVVGVEVPLSPWEETDSRCTGFIPDLLSECLISSTELQA